MHTTVSVHSRCSHQWYFQIQLAAVFSKQQSDKPAEQHDQINHTDNLGKCPGVHEQKQALSDKIKIMAAVANLVCPK